MGNPELIAEISHRPINTILLPSPQDGSAAPQACATRPEHAPSSSRLA